MPCIADHTRRHRLVVSWYDRDSTREQPIDVFGRTRRSQVQRDLQAMITASRYRVPVVIGQDGAIVLHTWATTILRVAATALFIERGVTSASARRSRESARRPDLQRSEGGPGAVVAARRLEPHGRSCTPANGVPDRTKCRTMSLGVTNVGTAATTTVGTLQATGASRL